MLLLHPRQPEFLRPHSGSFFEGERFSLPGIPPCHPGSRRCCWLQIREQQTRPQKQESEATQAQRYSTGDLRDVYFYRSQLKGHTEREYRPGNWTEVDAYVDVEPARFQPRLGLWAQRRKRPAVNFKDLMAPGATARHWKDS